MPQAVILVDVFIAKVDAAGEAHFAIDDHDLAVIAVIVDAADNGTEGVELMGVDSFCAQGLVIAARKHRDRANIIIDQMHFHAFLGFLNQDFMDAIPHLARVDDEVFHEDELLRAAQSF